MDLKASKSKSSFSAKEIAYLSVSEGNLTADSVDDEFMRFIRAGLNQRERKLIALRTRQALERKREKGERVGGRPRYGWRVVNGALVPDPEEQRAIDRMKSLYRRDTPPGRLCKH